MARARSRKASAWNKAVKAAFSKGAKNLKAAVQSAKKSYKPKAGAKKSASPRRARRCPKGMHKRKRGTGKRCVKN
jgi:hypothetical protein